MIKKENTLDQRLIIIKNKCIAAVNTDYWFFGTYKIPRIMKDKYWYLCRLTDSKIKDHLIIFLKASSNSPKQIKKHTKSPAIYNQYYYSLQ